MSALRISVADDEPDMREYYQRMLTHLGHHVVSCSTNGRELVDECLRQLPDLVITDIKMPEMDGLDRGRTSFVSLASLLLIVDASTLWGESRTSAVGREPGSGQAAVARAGP